MQIRNIDFEEIITACSGKILGGGGWLLRAVAGDVTFFATVVAGLFLWLRAVLCHMANSVAVIAL